MSTTTRVLDSAGRVVHIYVTDRAPWRGSGAYCSKPVKHAPTISVTGAYSRQYERYAYLKEQLELNDVRTGVNLVDADRTRHILEGEPVVRTVESTLFDEPVIATSVSGWSGGHANPDAAKYGKTQIPEFWTNDRFMFEVSDVLADPDARWTRQEDGRYFRTDEGAPERYVCVEERYGVPIRVVADRVDDEFRCVTAFPDYEANVSGDAVKTEGRSFSVNPVKSGSDANS